MIISERIFKILEEKGMTQAEFSKKTGITPSSISDWKRKKTNPSSDKIMIICDVLGVAPYELLQDTVRTENGDKRDYIVISKGTDNYELFMEIEMLDAVGRERLKGYIKALTEK